MNAKVAEKWVDQVKPGQKVRIQVDAFPARELTGTVGWSYPLPDPTSYLASKVKVYTTMISIDEDFPDLRPGMTARAEIPILDLEDVVRVPRDALVALPDGKDGVALRAPDGGRIEWREVTVGAAGNQYVEIKKGLQKGDRVRLFPKGFR